MDLDITSTRTSNNKIKLSFFAEDMLRYILGSYYTNWHGYELKEKEWKYILHKLCAKLEIAIKRNITTDFIHGEHLRESLESIKRKINEKNNSDPDIIMALVGLCFYLIGDFPNNTDKKHANKEKYFDLADKRSLLFLQDKKQKIKVILESSRHAPFSNFYTYDDLISKFYLDFESKPQLFIDWYKAEYPQLYAKIF